MTKTLGTDSKNDLFLNSDKNIALYSGLDAIIAACETATKAQYGEMVLQITQGVPNFQTVWIGSPNYSLYTSYIRNTLRGVDGVQDVVSLVLEIKDNSVLYTAQIQTAFGIGVVNG